MKTHEQRLQERFEKWFNQFIKHKPAFSPLDLDDMIAAFRAGIEFNKEDSK